MTSELIRFCAVGAVATGTHVLIAVAVERWTGAGPQLANLCGYANALIVSYVGHSVVTFGFPALRKRQAASYAVVSLSGLLFGTVLVQVLSVGFGVDYGLVMMVVGACVAAWTFAMSKLWVFSRRRRSSAATRSRSEVASE